MFDSTTQSSEDQQLGKWLAALKNWPFIYKHVSYPLIIFMNIFIDNIIYLCVMDMVWNNIGLESKSMLLVCLVNNILILRQLRTRRVDVVSML